MIPHGKDIKVMATRARHGHRLGESFVFVEIDAFVVPDFVLTMTPEQARDLASRLMNPVPEPSENGSRIRPVRWLRRITRRGA